MDRNGVEREWERYLVGGVRREELVRWAGEQRAELASADLMVEVGLQSLAGLRLTRWSVDKPHRGGVAGEFVQEDEKVALLLDGWRNACARYDESPGGGVWIAPAFAVEQDGVDPLEQFFDCSWQGVTELSAPGPMKLPDALAWSRKRASVVTLRLPDGSHYSAGKVSPGLLPKWDW